MKRTTKRDKLNLLRKKGGGKVLLSINKKEIILLLVIYILAAGYLLYFSPACGRGKPHRLIQLIPMKTVVTQLLSPRGIDNLLGNLIGNIVVLLPVGLALSALIPSGRKRSTAVLFLLLFMGMATIIELFQYILRVGCLDIDDIWMNGLGGFLGWKAGKRLVLNKIPQENPVDFLGENNTMPL